MKMSSAARSTALSTVLALTALAGCREAPTEPSAVPDGAARFSHNVASLKDRVAGAKQYLGGASYRYFFGHSTASNNFGSLFDVPGIDVIRALPNVLVNSRTGSGLGQSETAVAQSGLNVVAGWNDAAGFSDFNSGLSGWGVSTDGGRTWTDGGGLPRQPTPNFQHIGDPELKAAAGSFYYSDLCVDGAISGVCLTKGAVVGGTVAWGLPVYAAQTTADFLDKVFMTVSSSGLDVYMSYTRFINGGGNGQIEVVASHDGGLTWGIPVVLAAAGGQVNQGSDPAIGPGGELYVVWEQGWLQTSSPTLKLRKSTDGGLTFSAAVTVATIGSLAFSPPVGYNRSNINDFPRIAVSPSGTGVGNVYVSYHSVTAGNSDVFIARSTNGGASFSAGVKINEDAGTALQWWPTVKVDGNGNVFTHFYDRRLNPGTAVTDVFWSISTDGGLTFEPNQRVTTTSTNWSTTATDIVPNFGDYNGIAVVASGLNSIGFSVWADGRLGDPDVFFSRLIRRP